jgi:hypothetical protein
MQREHRGLAVVLATALASCGGGGGSSAPPPPPPPPNVAPVVADASLTTNEDQEGTLTVSATDANGDNIAAAVTTAPQKGRVSVSGMNVFTFTYTPDANVNGSDSFVFRVTDGRGGESQATVSVAIVPQPDYPTLSASSFSIEEDEQLFGDLQAEDVDGDAITYSVAVPPNVGYITMDPATGAFTYTPAANLHGTDQFRTRASSGGMEVTAVTTITIGSLNDAPTAAEDHAVIHVPGPLAVPVLLNDLDVDGDTLAVSIESPTPGVTATVVGGTIEVTSLPGMQGPTSLDYRVTDSAGASATATLRMIVGGAQNFFYLAATGANDAPEIWRFDRFFAYRARAPIPDGHTLQSFTSSPDGGMLAYTTVQAGMASRHWLWVMDQYEDEPVKQVNTPSNYLTGELSLNSTGDLLIFDDQVVDTRDPSSPRFIEAGVTVQNAVFEPHTTIYYSVVLPGGGRAIRRVKVAADGTPFDRAPVTANYNVGEGVGVDFVRAPNNVRIVSTGLLMPPPSVGTSIKQNAFVTWWDGSSGDTKLHPDFTHATDIALQPWVTADSVKTVYYAILGGVSGLYSTDLFNPGIAVRLMPLAPNEAEVLLHGDSSTVFAKGPLYWSRATIGVANTSVPFVPSPSTPFIVPRRLATAPDGHAVVFDVGAGVYATLGAQFDQGTLLHTRADGGLPPMLSYSPDGTVVAVVEPGSTGSVLVNPRAVGWRQTLDPAPAVFSGPVSTCIAFTGQGC